MLAGVKKDRVAFLHDSSRTSTTPTRGGEASDELIPYSKSIAWRRRRSRPQQCIVAFGTTDFREDLKKVTVPDARRARRRGPHRPARHLGRKSHTR
jgi:hypothetical protein